MHSVAQPGSGVAQTETAPGAAAARARIAIAGATGYTGQELLRLLSRHPLVALGAAMSSGQTGASSRRLPGLTHLWDGVITPLSAATLASDADVVFLALPDSAAADLTVDAKSGVSGAGKTPSERTHFSEVHGSMAAYGVFNHRHGAEIEQGVGREVTFTPHLVPLDRGILATIYARVAPGTTEEALSDVLEQAYAGATFVRLVGSALPEI